jgi:hypothetical protein
MAEVHDAVAAYCSEFSAPTYSRGQLDLVLKKALRAQKMLGYVVSAGYAHMAALGDRDHARQVQKDLALGAGSTPGEAERLISAGAALAGCPELEAAARSGQLSSPQLAICAGLAAEDPEGAARLAAQAGGWALSELSEAAGRLVAARRGAEELAAAAHAARSARQWTTPDGTWHLRANGPAAMGAVVGAAIAAAQRGAFAAARAEGRHERADARLPRRSGPTTRRLPRPTLMARPRFSMPRRPLRATRASLTSPPIRASWLLRVCELRRAPKSDSSAMSYRPPGPSIKPKARRYQP